GSRSPSIVSSRPVACGIRHSTPSLTSSGLCNSTQKPASTSSGMVSRSASVLSTSTTSSSPLPRVLSWTASRRSFLPPSRCATWAGQIPPWHRDHPTPQKAHYLPLTEEVHRHRAQALRHVRLLGGQHPNVHKHPHLS
ncbi:hypothetical protein K523DRAFT_409049, partial [Schizophyllum commune Tattone D]